MQCTSSLLPYHMLLGMFVISLKEDLYSKTQIFIHTCGQVFIVPLFPVVDLLLFWYRLWKGKLFVFL
jgi:hypothetical protein